MSGNMLEAPERVLSTLNPDGTRLWMRPKAAFGRWWKRRRVVAWVLMILFNVIPWLTVNGKPLMLLDVIHRDFVFFGVVFQPTEVLLLALLLITVFLSIFLITALLGRGWCGWACPQTVYLEFLYRPIERLVYGEHGGRAKQDVPMYKRVIKFGLFFIVSLHLSHTFLAYFIGPEDMFHWTTGSPSDHPAGFAIVYGVAALMMFDFGFFREQMCTLVCPYARLQSVLLDRDSLIIGYDDQRGEPRHKGKKKSDTQSGDCIDCNLCVAACPTGIDIRDGLQLECIACTQCIDACDAVMEKIERPRGLIRFASQNTLSGVAKKFWRPRIVIYPLSVAIVLASFLTLLGNRATSEVVFRRVQSDVPVLLGDGVLQSVMLDLANNSDFERSYTLVVNEPAYSLVTVLPNIKAYGKRVVQLPIKVPVDAFVNGKYTMTLTVSDDGNLNEVLTKTLFGHK